VSERAQAFGGRIWVFELHARRLYEDTSGSAPFCRPYYRLPKAYSTALGLLIQTRRSFHRNRQFICLPKACFVGVPQKSRPMETMISVRILDDHTVEIISKKAGKTMFTEVDTVFPDGGTFTQVVKDTNLTV
jgi:hypothetical protein